MVEEKMKSPSNKFLYQIAPLLFFVAVMFGMSFYYPMWMDEYVFYRLADSFPDYSMNKSIFFEDRPEILTPTVEWDSLDRDEMLSLVYDTPIYTHTPLMVMAMSPIVKGLNYLADEGIISHIEDEPGYIGVTEEEMKQNRAETMTSILRVISIFVVAASMWLIFKMMEHKVGKNAYLFAIPVAGSIMALMGAFLFYWDVFMIFFFVLTLYLMEVKPQSKWKYVTACALVNTKLFIGIMFLFPLAVKALKEDGWWKGFKMALPALSILPFYIATVIITGEPLYIFTHYLAQVPLHNFIYTLNSPMDYLVILLNLGMPVFLITTTPILWFWKKYPEYVIFWAMAMFYAWATGLGITHTSTLVYSGALVAPLVAFEFDIVSKLQRWTKSKKKGDKGDNSK
tara:strand:+ start:1206 stop:2396 length:1191 start_codon:yes stop_codon:yes gene_type:complete